MVTKSKIADLRNAARATRDEALVAECTAALRALTRRNEPRRPRKGGNACDDLHALARVTARIEHAQSGTWLLSVQEMPRPLVKGDKVRDAHGEFALVYEVRRLKRRSSPIAGENRVLWCVLHAGAGSAIIAVDLSGRQREFYR